MVLGLGISAVAVTPGWQCPAREGETKVKRYSEGRLVSGIYALPRVRYHVDVHVEGGFARTTIDQVYYNGSFSRREGTYDVELPQGASISRLAMTVKGVLREGAMVEKKRGRRIFDTIRNQRRDPVLLEWIDGERFKMRVFPIEPEEHKRILISYTQPLLEHEGHWHYQFPEIDSVKTMGYSARVRVVDGGQSSWVSSHAVFEAQEKGGDLVLEATQREPVRLRVEIPKGASDGAFQWFQAEDGHRYAMVRLRPTWEKRARAERRHWIVLYEASADRDPHAAREQINALRALQRFKQAEDRLTVIVANTTARMLGSDALEELETVHLIGGLDMAKAFDAVSVAITDQGDDRQPVLVHLGGGKVSLGERDAEALTSRLPKGLRYLGLGVGSKPNMPFFEAMATHLQGAAVSLLEGEACVPMLEQIDWLPLREVSLSSADGSMSAFRSGQSTLMVGNAWFAVARLSDESPRLPDSVTLRGMFGGEPWEQTWPTTWTEASQASFLPRIWARTEIERLSKAEPIDRSAIIALSQKAFVMSPYTSLLVLEDDAMHERFKVSLEQRSHWAKYEEALPEELPTPPIIYRKKGEPRPSKAGTLPLEHGRIVRPPYVPVDGATDVITTSIPEAMFSGTKVPIKLPNLEKPSDRETAVGVSSSSALAIAWCPMFAGERVTLGDYEEQSRISRQRYRSFFMPKGTKLLSKGAEVESSDPLPVIGEISYVTDGDKDAADGSYVELGPGRQWVQIDLGETQELWLIGLWHFHKNVRAYIDVIVQVSDDPNFVDGVETVFNNDHDNSSGMGLGLDKNWIEENIGKMLHLKGQRARYVRLHSNGNTSNEMNHYIEVEVWGRKVSDEPGLAELRDRLEQEERGVAERWPAPKKALDLRWLRNSHSRLLTTMSQLAGKPEAPSNLLERARTAADRWWGIDGASPRACQEAAFIMRRLGRNDLEWAYLTTPIAVYGSRSTEWERVLAYAERTKDKVLIKRVQEEQKRAADVSSGLTEHTPAKASATICAL